MKLAMRLGRTLGELQQTLSSEEFSWWLALYRREPWDEWPGYFQAGVVASTIANYAGKMREQSAPPAVPGDFMLRLEEAPEATNDREEPDPHEHFLSLMRQQGSP